MSTELDILQRPISDLQMYDLTTIEATNTVADAIRVIADSQHACAVLIDNEGKPVGHFTERQVIKLLRDGSDLDNKVIQHQDTPRIPTIASDGTIAKAIELIDECDVGYLCMVDSEGKAQALMGQRGIVDYIVDHCPRAVLTSRLGAHPAIAEREGA